MFSNEFIGFWRLWEEWKMMTSENVITIFLRFIVIRSPPMRPSLRGYLHIPSIFRIWQLSLLYLRQLLTDWLSVYTWPDFFGLHADGGWQWVLFCGTRYGHIVYCSVKTHIQHIELIWLGCVVDLIARRMENRDFLFINKILYYYYKRNEWINNNNIRFI